MKMRDYTSEQINHNRKVWDKLFAQNVLYVMEANRVKTDAYVMQANLLEKLDPTHIDEDIYKVDWDHQYLPY
jgi:hypothetical protein